MKAQIADCISELSEIIKIPYSGFTTISLHFESFVQLKVKQEKTFRKFKTLSKIYLNVYKWLKANSVYYSKCSDSQFSRINEKRERRRSQAKLLETDM